MPSALRPVILLLGCIMVTAACSDPTPERKPPVARKPAAQVPAAPPPVVAAPPAVAPAAPSPLANAVNGAAFDPAATTSQARQAALVRAQVLLDRAHFSPGVIDGQEGSNLAIAVSAFQEARRLTVDGKLSSAVWDALVAADAGPALTDYLITAEDVAGPFVADLPKDDYEAMARLPALSYGSPLEALAEKFHMDEPLLQALNPGVDFGQAGATIVVAALGAEGLDGKVTRIAIDNARGVLKAYADDDRLLAVYPATVGSTERPAPVGEWAVNTVAPRPTYTYDPSRLTFGKPKGKLTLKAGPNNPVGSTWIDLTKDTYGIHGTPDPRLVNKRASHGCVRLTNWDAAELGAAVVKGARVVFGGKPVR